MELWEAAVITVFVIVTATIVVVGSMYKGYKQELRIYKKLELERRAYLKAEGKAIQHSLAQYQLTIYLDEELDATHEKARQEYERMGMDYFYYPEKSYELVRLQGHRLMMNKPLAYEIIGEFCLQRYLLLDNMLLDAGLTRHTLSEIIHTLYLLLKPKLDITTAKQQRMALLLNAK